MPCWMTIPLAKSPYEIPSGLRRQHDGAWEGDDIWYQRLWRQLTPETMEPSLNSRNVSCYRCFALISHGAV